MYIGSIDMGGSKTIVAVLDESFRILTQTRFEGHEKDWRIHFDRTVGLLRECCDALNITIQDLDCLGVIPPGMVENGILLLAPATGWRNVDMCGEFYARTKIPCIATDCDVNASAIGEADLDGIDDFFWMNISNGIGAAIILNKENYPGANGVSGEIGHVKVEYDNPRPCPCGQWGCTEAMASGAAIGRRVQETAEKDPGFRRRLEEKGLPVNAYGASVLAREGDETACALIAEAGKYIGRAVAIALNVVNPPRVFVGGGVSQSLDLLLPYIREEIGKGTVEFARNVPIEQSRLGYYAALKGAAAIALRAWKKQNN